ncbi:hypothetical protein LEN26_020702 [Aphanomyces euteiches]|nr:hypothetical protein LEN26_020702 [Aphanomyces euteiches]KAH9129132.1 hypothetical protein AeMF1_000787 [Aphanomyces euteiches]KAH9189698.1 hypothetical protein AeNC1_008332 [Aphanomyces euteiches]
MAKQLALYYSPGRASMVVHVMLQHLNLPHTLHFVDVPKRDQHTPEYLRLNPNGHVPTLLIDEKPMCEAAAITMFLADRYYEAKLAPSADDPKRQVYLQWFFHFANTLQPAYRLWFYPSDLPGVDHEQVKVAVRARIEKTWEQVDQHLQTTGGPFMLGEDVTALDIYATMLMRWSRNMPKPATEWPHVATLANHVTSLPSWQKVNEIEGNKDWL